MEKIRIQKLLSDAGYCSRRKAEALIAAGRVKCNGHPVRLGDRATKADLLTVNLQMQLQGRSLCTSILFLSDFSFSPSITKDGSDQMK